MASAEDAASFEILEHTADIGLRARGATLEELFENAARGLATILDRSVATPEGEPPTQRSSSAQAGSPARVELEAGDLEGLLVAWMDEALFLLQERDACLGEVHVRTVEDVRLRADMVTAPCSHPVEGTDLKAATYHQLAIRPDGEGYWATVYFDV